jgi:predicted nucleic acid-binding protein
VLAGSEDEAARKMPLLVFLRRAQKDVIAPSILAWDLGPGESEVLSFALHQNGHLAIIDDKAARTCARSLKINSLGTVGLFVLAKRRNLLSEVIPCIQHLRDAGLWLSDRIIESVKQQAGE